MYVISNSDPPKFGLVGNKQHKIIREDGCVNDYITIALQSWWLLLSSFVAAAAAAYHVISTAPITRMNER